MARKKLPVKKFHVVKKKHTDERKTELTDAELAELVTDAQVKVVRQRERAARTDVATKDMKNVIADTLERLGYAEGENGRLNAEEYWAHNIVLAMKYGIKNDGYLQSHEPDIEILEHEYEKVPYCKEHK